MNYAASSSTLCWCTLSEVGIVGVVLLYCILHLMMSLIWQWSNSGFSILAIKCHSNMVYGSDNVKTSVYLGISCFLIFLGVRRHRHYG